MCCVTRLHVLQNYYGQRRTPLSPSPPQLSWVSSPVQWADRKVLVLMGPTLEHRVPL